MPVRWPLLPSVSAMRVLIVTESFLPQINGVTNSVRRVHRAPGSRGPPAPSSSRPPVPTCTPASACVAPAAPTCRSTRTSGSASRPGAGCGRSMLRFRPDVVHIASPATLGYQAARAAGELGIPTVAIYQTDLVGFAERYDVPGGARAAAALTRKIHSQVDRTLAPSTASLVQLEELGVPGLARWGRGVDLRRVPPAAPRRAAPALRSRPRARCSSGTSAASRPRRSSSC